ncbi:UDP rhamnose-anthocyanidin-3-glucoside rhamnosyltransferase-like protein [Corchorus olitorius]|uniref:UDP rhamnose-anthocyanidin-3-glucoside rhamnosyltransferase-like protein n=1 Tax=Corchorus olitorius TaxID=93759 RepID=A0A1R3KPM2_9ROSI|nr:UDP rhamnose-anthocyanidin-3-glucoside rhamnosyltransferase-like protein [Corchorus olitorius]
MKFGGVRKVDIARYLQQLGSRLAGISNPELQFAPSGVGVELWLKSSLETSFRGFLESSQGQALVEVVDPAATKGV